MASSDILSQTLHSITETKLDELSKKRTNFEQGKADLLKRVDAEPIQREKVRILLHGTENLPFMTNLDTHPSLSSWNMKHFLEQARSDPSVSQKLQKDWEAKLRSELDVQSLRFEYASLYGRLVKEWLASPGIDKSSESDSFEEVGRKEMHEQRATWEAYVFQPLETDSKAIKLYLDGLFYSSKQRRKALELLRCNIKYFEDELSRPNGFDEHSLKWCINGLLASDLLTDAKRSVLSDFQGNKLVLQELADVLNMRMSALDNWSWGEKGTPVEQRRQLNGRYRFYHDEDLLQTIFLRYIGVRWSVCLKAELELFTKTEGIWLSSSIPITKKDRERRNHFLGFEDGDSEHRVEVLRESIWRNDVFLEQLQSTEEEGGRAYDADTMRRARKSDHPKTPQEVTQSVLHLLVTDIIMKTRLGEDVTVIRSDFKWFGPSLPHSTMFAVLQYFGVSDRWVNFFRRALEAPMQFVKDGPNAPVQVRKRGTPISGPLSDFLGESVLFCLDFAINQRTNGARLFRLHDDIWFWGSEKTCEIGWNAMCEFSDLMGLQINADKTGTVLVTKKGEKPREPSKILPMGDVRWGFLKLNAATGRFLIDQAQVDEHIVELHRQLDACKSVFDWIQAFNVYGARFFTTNFGRPANCNGRAHVDMMLDTFEKIQRKLFADVPGGSVTDAVKKMLADRFDAHDIPEGYLYFPMNMGGLDLRNPFIGLYQIRERLSHDPDLHMNNYFEEEEAAYRRAKERFESGLVTHSNKLKDENFMSWEEYTRYREQTSLELGKAFRKLMTEPFEDGARMTKDIAAVIDMQEWLATKPYQQWVLGLYASEMIAKFGGLNVVEKGLLPTGMVSMFRQSRFQWAG